MVTNMKALQARLRQRFGSYCLYQRLRTSPLCDLYRRLSCNGDVIQRRERELRFYRGVLWGLRKGDLIFDIGANGGDKTDIFLRLGARVVAVEPDERNQEILSQRFQRLRLIKQPVSIVGKAVSDSVRKEVMWIDTAGSAVNTLSRKWVDTLRCDAGRFGTTLEFGREQSTETTTLDKLSEMFGRPFYAKIDVEGHEPAVLRGLHRPIPYISFEVNLPEFRQEGLECIERVNEIDASTGFNYTTDCERGLALKEWVGRSDFVAVFSQITEPSVEVFSAIPLPAGHKSVRGD
jgi:FkbM family methyltransferase